jgi:hypothetical protein
MCMTPAVINAIHKFTTSHGVRLKIL